MKTMLLVLALALLPSTATAQLHGGYGGFYGGYAHVLRVGYVNPGFGYYPYGRYRYGRYYHGRYRYGHYPAWHHHHGYGCRWH